MMLCENRCSFITENINQNIFSQKVLPQTYDNMPGKRQDNSFPCALVCTKLQGKMSACDSLIDTAEILSHTVSIKNR